MTEVDRTPGQPRVLVAEDDTIVAMMIEEMLQDLGCEVVGPVSRMEDALEAARSEDLAAALLDVNLQAKLVYPVADALAERGVRFAFMTGYGDAIHPASYRTYPSLPKPYDPEDVRRVVSDLLSLQA